MLVHRWWHFTAALPRGRFPAGNAALGAAGERGPALGLDAVSTARGCRAGQWHWAGHCPGSVPPGWVLLEL